MAVSQPVGDAELQRWQQLFAVFESCVTVSPSTITVYSATTSGVAEAVVAEASHHAEEQDSAVNTTEEIVASDVTQTLESPSVQPEQAVAEIAAVERDEVSTVEVPVTVVAEAAEVIEVSTEVLAPPCEPEAVDPEPPTAAVEQVAVVDEQLRVVEVSQQAASPEPSSDLDEEALQVVAEATVGQAASFTWQECLQIPANVFFSMLDYDGKGDVSLSVRSASVASAGSSHSYLQLSTKEFFGHWVDWSGQGESGRSGFGRLIQMATMDAMNRAASKHSSLLLQTQKPGSASEFFRQIQWQGAKDS